jgi:hypothetical protein
MRIGGDMKKLFLIVLLVISGFAEIAGADPVAKVTIKAMNQQDEPLSKAEVDVYFNDGINTNKVTGWTNNKGLYTTRGKTRPNWAAVVSQKGYYDSGDGFRFKESENYLFFKRWLPWNPTIEIVLREKRNPVMMYRKCTGFVKVPVQNKPTGYDLIKGDWVSPYGDGKVKDFIFIYKSRYGSNLDWEGSYTVYFSNEGDGFQEYNPPENIDSEYKWPYKAPVEGYNIKKYSRYRKYHNTLDPYKKASFTNLKKDQRYIFRVRTEYNDSGEVVGGMYGKKTEIFI